MQITPKVTIDPDEIQETFLRSSGPGGQNVNKVESAVQLRFDVRNSPSLPEDAKPRLERLAGHRMTADGILIITARQFRTQDRNRQDARDRLAALVRQALVRPKPRRPTRPTLASKKRRVDAKKARATVKAFRSRKPPLE